MSTAISPSLEQSVNPIRLNLQVYNEKTEIKSVTWKVKFYNAFDNYPLFTGNVNEKASSKIGPA